MVYPGMPITVAIDPKKASWYKHASQLPIDLRIAGTSVDISDYYDTDTILSSDWLNFVSGTVQTDIRNSAADITAQFRGAGYAMNDTSTIDTCEFDGTTCYHVRVMPSVTAVSHNEGYAQGGQLLTITGTSLDGDVTVTVDDLPCEV